MIGTSESPRHRHRIMTVRLRTCKDDSKNCPKQRPGSGLLAVLTTGNNGRPTLKITNGSRVFFVFLDEPHSGDKSALINREQLKRRSEGEDRQCCRVAVPNPAVPISFDVPSMRSLLDQIELRYDLEMRSGTVHHFSRIDHDPCRRTTLLKGLFNMTYRFTCAIAMLLMIGAGSMARAEDLQAMSRDSAQLYAQHLSEMFERANEERQVKFEIDPSQAAGLHVGGDGILVVPAKGLKPGATDPAVESEKGGGLCYVFMSPCYAPLVDGKSIDAKKLRKVKYSDGQGGDREAICLVMSVRHVEGDDWRLYGYGAESKPLIDARFSESSENVEETLAMRVTSPKEGKANLALTLFKKYSASFAIGAK